VSGCSSQLFPETKKALQQLGFKVIATGLKILITLNVGNTKPPRQHRRGLVFIF
jgi:hypothetical protein